MSLSSTTGHSNAGDRNQKLAIHSNQNMNMAWNYLLITSVSQRALLQPVSNQSSQQKSGDVDINKQYSIVNKQVNSG